MKVNPNDPAMPHRNHDRVSGMSIRTELAARAMNGLLANSKFYQCPSEDLITASVLYADALIKELNKPTE